MFERKELFVPVVSIHVAKQQVSSQEPIHIVSAAFRKREIIGCRWLKSVLARKIAGFAVWLILILRYTIQLLDVFVLRPLLLIYADPTAKIPLAHTDMQ